MVAGGLGSSSRRSLLVVGGGGGVGAAIGGAGVGGGGTGSLDDSETETLQTDDTDCTTDTVRLASVSFGKELKRCVFLGGLVQFLM